MGRLKTLLILFKCLAILTEPTVTTLSHTRLTFRDDEDGDFSGDGALGFDETPVHAPRDFITEVHEQGGDYAASRHHFPRGDSRGKFVHAEMVTPKMVKPESRRSDKKSTLKQTKTGAFVKGASTQRQHIPSQGTVLSQGTNNPRESKTKTPNSNRHKYSQTPENHLFFATQDETLLSMMEAAGGSHRKVIVYNLVPDTLRDRIEKDRRETGQRILPGDMRRAYYDRIANSVHENGRHGAIVFDKDARIEKKWPSEETDSQGVTEFVDGEPLDKDGRESTDRQEHSWPSFRSLLKTRGKVESKDRALTKEESVKKGAWSIRKEVESVDEDYQSDSYHRRVPEIDGKWNENVIDSINISRKEPYPFIGT
ncbi:hypothetical protein M8J77_025705 [Diaphorina citri]|nr:hypothetical protein M8J77_025705 [Diaphorina citri]